MSHVMIALKPRIFVNDANCMGPGKADLLQAIADNGSISAAARQMQTSYRRAWLLVDSMNSAFKRPLVEAAKGGSGGGGAQVTAEGHKILILYRQMQAKLEREAAAFLSDFQRRL